MKPEERIFAYHEGTKHHFERYAPGPGRLDWATQPHPLPPLRRRAPFTLDWSKPEGCPPDIPLYRLVRGDAREAHGPWAYPRLHWEGGLKREAFHSLYHFTVGRAVEDPRLTVLSAYEPA